jgi:hypothetical protein
MVLKKTAFFGEADQALKQKPIVINSARGGWVSFTLPIHMAALAVFVSP